MSKRAGMIKVFGAVLATVALVGMTAGGARANAKEDAKAVCENVLGGTFVETDGAYSCNWDDGSSCVAVTDEPSGMEDNGSADGRELGVGCFNSDNVLVIVVSAKKGKPVKKKATTLLASPAVLSFHGLHVHR